MANAIKNNTTEYILCCPTLACELEAALQQAGTADTYNVVYLPDEIHRDPAELKCYLQQTIDQLTDATRIVVLPSGCGGGTAGLIACRGEINIPKTRDCLDVLLSTDSLKNLNRPLHHRYRNLRHQTRRRLHNATRKPTGRHTPIPKRRIRHTKKSR